ncbi:g-D-glutamyl-meso-diaminopimelate peptidase [[Clostridium] aminophilum]|uniref:G-D-glutamyl-meso-diaminopimelate peptidase n=2 Tax=[Clostridium] aminophilum TaxID=1526 RepID=A0A1I6K6U8_9FIRM|nr:g-D-glutamyl-meso-diaminopimelate peptidase [[Clostridium] aminophilum]
MKQKFTSVRKYKTTAERTAFRRRSMKSATVITLTAALLTLSPSMLPMASGMLAATGGTAAEWIEIAEAAGALKSVITGEITAYAGPASEITGADGSSNTDPAGAAANGSSGTSGGGSASGPAGTGTSGGGAVTGPAGSGSSSQTGGTGASGGSGTQTMQNDNYYNAGYSDSIVNPVDRYSYDQMSADMNALKAKYPNLVTVSSIGTTADGRQIYDIAIGNTGARKKILFQGAMHAREYIVVPILMRQAENLLQGAANGGTLNGTPVSSLLQNMCIHFIPMTNPDGVSLSQFGLGGIGHEELRNGIQQMYAQDLAEGVTQVSFEEYLRRWKSNARGVDLNRNFDAGWAEKKTVEHPSNQGYKGMAPLSETESKALADFIDREGFRAVINYHAMGDVIYWDTENNREAAVSLEFANLVHNANGYAIQSCDGVAGLKDWLQRRANSIPGITIEVGRSNAPVNFGEFSTLWEQNKMVPGLIAQSVMSR